uniref:Uncharacterized protein n=1 Tax=Anguilla anguilla TaxID=7936 RepID=A0A0E9RQK5_ANGAN
MLNILTRALMVGTSRFRK